MSAIAPRSLRLAALAAILGAACLLAAPSLAAQPQPIMLGSGVPAPTAIDRAFEGAETNGSPLFLGPGPVGDASLKSFGAARGRQPGAVPDAEIERTIDARLAAEPGLKGSVEVHSTNGRVKVSGRVTTTGMVYRIISLIEGVDGVVGVDERELEVI